MISSTPRLLLATLLGLAVPSVSVVALAQTSAAPAAKVNGVVIPKSRVDVFVKAQSAQGTPDTPDDEVLLKAILTVTLVMMLWDDDTQRDVMRHAGEVAVAALLHRLAAAAADRAGDGTSTGALELEVDRDGQLDHREHGDHSACVHAAVPLTFCTPALMAA